MVYNTYVYGSNARNLPVWLFLSQTSKNAMFFLLIFYVFSSIKLENKRAEQILPGSRGSVSKVAQRIDIHLITCKNDKIKKILNKYHILKTIHQKWGILAVSTDYVL
jgi:predicted nucleotide-binding protein (sugar kinase/HSP70/actin superfamily)